MGDLQRVHQEVDLAYFAGVLDSDGWITAGTFKKFVGKIYYHRICVKQIEPEAVNFIHANFGGSVSVQIPEKSNLGSKPLYLWQMGSKKDLVLLLPKLIPFLKIKRLRAELMLDLIENIRDLRSLGPLDSAKELHRRDKILAKMKATYGR